MSWLYSWVVNLLPIPYLTFVTKFEPLCSQRKIFSSKVFVCDPLNPFVMGGRSFSSMVTVSGPSPMFSLLRSYQPNWHPMNSHIPKNKPS